jgi:hypothetical protein
MINYPTRSLLNTCLAKIRPIAMCSRTLRLSLLLLFCLPLLGGNCENSDAAKQVALLEGPPGGNGVQLDGGDLPSDAPVNPIPEPSAGLVFGAGTLMVYGALKSGRKRD